MKSPDVLADAIFTYRDTEIFFCLVLKDEREF